MGKIRDLHAKFENDYRKLKKRFILQSHIFGMKRARDKLRLPLERGDSDSENLKNHACIHIATC